MIVHDYREEIKLILTFHNFCPTFAVGGREPIGQVAQRISLLDLYRSAT
jgi:hypothetical protein